MMATVIRDRCGSYAGWSAHARHQESPCDPCREARREYNRLLKRKHRGERMWGVKDRVLDVLQLSPGWWDVYVLAARVEARPDTVRTALRRLRAEGLVESRESWVSDNEQLLEWRSVYEWWEV